jgi:hypothetical protein
MVNDYGTDNKQYLEKAMGEMTKSWARNISRENFPIANFSALLVPDKIP